ncbi:MULTISPECIES: DUF2785 domain-containing protein [unclassified Sphingopyxis]|jgi:hypothetical protein|uniref:DUF2785 domain-containing protein n=1 Tax=unclassified Sphingopyxis TaxID=2614943 RepID=UPI0028606C27|nr:MULTISPECIES: DUF2785 domain-containing protein [unclassified Sphingopyxis]MDR6833568.1 hypothetical protein [Sphingopyxis sp. BE122]MDR7225837.1 hypothetical protein [Sphingopyxis sp. BE259]
MRWIWGAVGGAAMLAVVPVAARTSDDCPVARPADGDLTAFASRYFPAANDAALDALIACLGASDPAVRDDFAFALWSAGLRGKHLKPDGMRHAVARLTRTLAAPEDKAGFRRPFAALALSEVARADRIEPFLTEAELHDLSAIGATYLRGVTDYRGFIAGEGWRHGVAHGADLAMQIALNPRLTRADADLLLGAIAAQVAPAGPHAYVHGEARRLARPLLFLAKRPDIDDAAWAAWFQALHPDAAARWQAPYASTAGLAAVHNSSAFGDAVYVAASESQDPQVRRLAPLAAGLLKALP